MKATECISITGMELQVLCCYSTLLFMTIFLPIFSADECIRSLLCHQLAACVTLVAQRVLFLRILHALRVSGAALGGLYGVSEPQLKLGTQTLKVWLLKKLLSAKGCTG